jgi:hypothetical protein
MRLQALKARPRRRRLLGERQIAAVAANVLDRPLAAPAPNRSCAAASNAPSGLQMPARPTPRDP